MAIGFWQILLILFGRGKLPALAEDLGKSVRSFKKGLDGDEAQKIEDKSEDKDEK